MFAHAKPAPATRGQDDRFLALLDKAEVRALQNAPNLIATAQKVCGIFDGGMNVDDVVDVMQSRAFQENRVY